LRPPNLRDHRLQPSFVMLFNATFNNISVISWRSLLLVKETEVPGENHRPVASHWQTLSHQVVLLSIVVFLTITSNSLPGTSEPRMPTIFLLLTGYVVISVMIVISVIIGLRFYLRDQELPVSSYWKWLILFYRIILGRRKWRTIKIGENLQNEDITRTENGKDKETVTWKTVGETTVILSLD
jgi:hypothetical protein